MTLTITANAVAWYAAVVATLSAGVSAFNAWRDRVALKVTARSDMRLTADMGPYSAEHTYILIEVANVGRRPVTLGTASLWIKKERKHAMVIGQWQPNKNLAEGQSATILCQQQSLDLEGIARVTVVDATGRKWHSKLTRTA